MKKFVNFIFESYKEFVSKVEWGTVGQLQNDTFMVVLMSCIISIMICIMDICLNIVISNL